MGITYFPTGGQLTSDELAGIQNASPALSPTNPAASEGFVNAAFEALKACTDHQESVIEYINYVKATAGAPAGAAASGEKCLNTAEDKLYSYTSAWDAGVACSDGDRYVFKTSGTGTTGNGTYTADSKIYELDAGVWDTYTPTEGTNFTVESDHKTWLWIDGAYSDITHYLTAADALTTAEVSTLQTTAVPAIDAASPALSATNPPVSRQSLAALAHQEPVDYTISYVKTTAPTGTSASVGEKCLDTVAKVLYTCVSGPVWDAGTALTAGQRCAHVLTGTDTSGDSGTYAAGQKIYTLVGSTLEETAGSAGMEFRAKDTELRWTYNAQSLFSSVLYVSGTGKSVGDCRLRYAGNTIYCEFLNSLPSTWASSLLNCAQLNLSYLFATQYVCTRSLRCTPDSGLDVAVHGAVDITAAAAGINFARKNAALSTVNIFKIQDDGSIVCLNGALASAQTKVASANVRNTDATEKTSTSATYAIAHTKTITNGLLGQARWLFDIKTSDTGEAAYGRIYKNGVAWGSEFSVSGPGSDSYATQSEDLTADLVPGDVITLRVHSGGTATVSVKNFNIAYDDAPVVAVAVANS